MMAYLLVSLILAPSPSFAAGDQNHCKQDSYKCGQRLVRATPLKRDDEGQTLHSFAQIHHVLDTMVKIRRIQVESEQSFVIDKNLAMTEPLAIPAETRLQLQHPNTASFLETGDDGDTPFDQ